MTDGAERAPRALVVALGPGEPKLVPAPALEALRQAGSVAPHELPAALRTWLESLGIQFDEGAATVCAPDCSAHALARRLPRMPTLPERALLARQAASAAAGALLELTAVLRRECPWDRAQTATSIVPHTIEEAYEVADAVREAGLSTKLLDELGDLLFQTTFLALLCEEAGQGSWVDVALGVTAKLRVRHPWVFGSESADSAGDARNLWEEVKVESEAARACSTTCRVRCRHCSRRGRSSAEPPRSASSTPARRRHSGICRARCASCEPSSATSPSPSASPWPQSSTRSAMSSSHA